MIRFKGKHIRFVTQKRRLPNGRVVNLEVIQHPGAVLIIPFLDDKHIVFIRQFRPVVDTYLYELPAGTIDGKESPLWCAKREIIEETGFIAGRIRPLGKIYPVPGYSTEVITIFKADRLKKSAMAAEPDEIIKTKVFSKNGIKYLFRKGKIKDAKTICALAFCGWL